ncbi:hypothetical protein NQ556_09100 [Coprococcus comes ATCC 27758]|nr:hypothetical protein [Coprococcus comes]QRT50243.1 hypothetical protein I6K69_02765 [Coprococcus comes]UWP12815.1 hypothetical protein NQ556_09100 [Coprococcus comes ATCC 27758]
MKNKEKYASEIIEIACSGNAVSVSKVTGKPIACEKNNCANCYRCNDFLLCDKERLKEWAELDHIEKPVISKRDRAFLEYIGTGINYITRDMDGGLFIYISKPHKLIDCWESSGCESDKSLKSFKLDFPMIKWSDSEPWLIEDLKKLEVVNSYE